MITDRIGYILLCLSILASTIGCRKEEPLSHGGDGDTRPITLSIGITTRAAVGSSIGDGSQPDDMKVWIFDNNDKKIAYFPIEDPQFYGSDILGELVSTIEEIIEIAAENTSLTCIVVLNSKNANGLELSGDSSLEDIREATFSSLVEEVVEDNKVPIYGESTFEIASDKDKYSIAIEATRAVGKLELFFTKSTESMQLSISNIKLEQIPTEGYIKKQQTLPEIKYTNTKDNILKDKSVTIEPYLSEDIEVGNFSSYETTYFTRLNLSTAYLLENPNGKDWVDTGTDKDFTYPYNDENSDIEDADTRYKITVNYQIGGAEKTQTIYLPSIIRNTWTKIFVRVKDNGQLTLSCSVMPWNDGGSIDISYDDGFSGTLDVTTATKITGDDNDKAYAIVYGDDEKWITFTFRMTTPVAATWTANLTNGSQFELISDNGMASGIGVGDKTDDENEGRVTFTVRPTQEFDLEQVHETDLYISVMSVNGVHMGEQTINHQSDFPGTATHIRIRQVSLEQWNSLQP